MRRIRFHPAVTLFLLAPVLGELVSTSAPPAEFFNPLTFIWLSVLYGGGALLIREAVVRRGKGWPTVLLLGAAYGIAEEGLIVASWFNPNWGDLGTMSNYGLLFGVQTTWALHLTIYHAIVSISVPIMLTHLLHPYRAGERWLGRGRTRLLTGVWLVNAVFLTGLMALAGSYLPPLLPYLGVLGLCVGLGWLALRLPVPADPAPPVQAARPVWFALAGAAFTFASFIIIGAGTESGWPAPLTNSLLLVLVAVGWWLLHSGLGNGLPVSPRHQYALACGVIGFFIVFGPLTAADPARLDNTTGVLPVALLMASWLVWQGRRLWQRTAPHQAESRAPVAWV